MEPELEKLKDKANIEGVTNENGGRVYPLKKRVDCTPEELEYQEKIWANNGKASEKKTQALRLAGLRRVKDPEKIKAKSLELLKDPNSNALQIIQLQQFLIESEALTDNNKIGLLKVLTDVHKAIHGQTSNVNVTSAFSDHLKEWVNARNGLKENQVSLIPLPAINAVVTEVTNDEDTEDENTGVIVVDSGNPEDVEPYTVPEYDEDAVEERNKQLAQANNRYGLAVTRKL